jgi:hypothetical protein
MRLFRKRTRTPVLEFCERCGSVCDGTCRANRLLDRARERALWNGPRAL